MSTCPCGNKLRQADKEKFYYCEYHDEFYHMCDLCMEKYEIDGLRIKKEWDSYGDQYISVDICIECEKKGGSHVKTTKCCDDQGSAIMKCSKCGEEMCNECLWEHIEK